MAAEPETAGELNESGLAALRRGEWAAARADFGASLALTPTAAAHDGLAWVGWWTGDEELTIGSRGTAFRLYREEGDASKAGMAASWLASDQLDFRGDDAVGSGWLARARRVLEGQPDCEGTGWLALIECNYGINVHADYERATELAREGARIGRALGSPDLESVGLAQEGIALVARGRTAEGMRCLDEASAIASQEDSSLPSSPGWTICCMVTACEGIGDLARAEQWSGTMRELASRWGGRHFMGMCRSAFGRVLAAGGDWPAAESELEAAAADLAASRPGMISGTLARLGELRARQGRIEEARELFVRAGAEGLSGLGRMKLEEGAAEEAAEIAERILRATDDAALVKRVEPLELLASARAAQGRPEEAKEACEALGAATSAFGTPFLEGRSKLCAGRVELAGGRADDARRHFEDAVDCFARIGAPYDEATARLALADALEELGRERGVAEETEAARELLGRLGVAVAASPPAEPEPGAVTGAGDAVSEELSPRELEILRLVAQGLSDAQIAERLVLSPHTVHRHVANIRTKLRLSSRAAAVAYAARAGLL